MLWIVFTSFRTQPSIFSGGVIPSLDELTLENYQTILSVTDFPRFFYNTFLIAIAVTFVSLVLSILIVADIEVVLRDIDTNIKFHGRLHLQRDSGILIRDLCPMRLFELSCE